MYLRSSSSSLRILTPLTINQLCSISSINSHIITTPLVLSCQSKRTFMFWRANVNRELYGTPKKALETERRRRLQKSLTQLIRDGQIWRLLKEGFLPELSKLWKEVQPWDRRYI